MNGRGFPASRSHAGLGRSSSAICQSDKQPIRERETIQANQKKSNMLAEVFMSVWWPGSRHWWRLGGWSKDCKTGKQEAATMLRLSSEEWRRAQTQEQVEFWWEQLTKEQVQLQGGRLQDHHWCRAAEALCHWTNKKLFGAMLPFRGSNLYMQSDQTCWQADVEDQVASLQTKTITHIWQGWEEPKTADRQRTRQKSR